MNPLSLIQLHRETLAIFDNDNFDLAGLDWIDHVLPRFTEACRNSIVDEDTEGFQIWRNWMDQGGLDPIRSAGDPFTFIWRQSWLKLLIDTCFILSKDGAFRNQTYRTEIAHDLTANVPSPFNNFLPDFWIDLVEHLSGCSDSADKTKTPVSIAFPLLLSEKMVIKGESTESILVDFILESTPYRCRSIYPDPREIAIRCFDISFLSIYKHAALLTSLQILPELRNSVRVKLRSRRPEHDLFLRKLVLAGNSGGGALAAGIYILESNKLWNDPSVAVSLALTGKGDVAFDSMGKQEGGNPTGNCYPVGGLNDKIRGSAKLGINRLIVASSQASGQNFYGHLNNVKIIGASTMQDVLQFINAPDQQERSQSDPFLWLSDNGGVLPLDSLLYMERPVDIAFRDALDRKPMIVLLKGPRQIGKTSLLVRGVDQARKQGARLVYSDLQSIGHESIHSPRDLFSAMSRIISRELKLNITMDDIYDERDGPNKNFESYLFNHVLSSPVIWFIDEVDQLFDFDFHTDIFSLMRSWHNRRPVHSELSNLTLVLAYATETHLFIKDPYQSPFNVGVKIEMDDFTAEHISVLNHRLNNPLKNELEISKFYDLVGGHPYLVCRGLSWMASENKDIDEFAVKSCMDNGPFGTHLRRLRLIAKNNENITFIQDLLEGKICTNNDVFLHLRTAGVLIGDDWRSARIRCRVYEEYLKSNIITNINQSKAPRRGGVLTLINAIRSRGKRS